MARITHATRVKWFNSVGGLFRLADRNELQSANPFAKIKLEKPKNAKANVREEWETGELGKPVASPVYADGKRPKGGTGEAA